MTWKFSKCYIEGTLHSLVWLWTYSKISSLGSERLNQRQNKQKKKRNLKYLILICFCTFCKNRKFFQHDCGLQMTFLFFAGETLWIQNKEKEEQHLHSLSLCSQLWHVFKSCSAAATAGPVWAACWRCADLSASRPRVWGNDASGCLRGQRETQRRRNMIISWRLWFTDPNCSVHAVAHSYDSPRHSELNLLEFGGTLMSGCDALSPAPLCYSHDSARSAGHSAACYKWLGRVGWWVLRWENI